MGYLHALKLKDWYPCWNVRISNMLTSADCADERAHVTGEHLGIRDASITDLKAKQITGFLQPRIMAALADPKKWDMEIRFEETRRRYAPNAPSRLSCLYLCEDSESGMRMLTKMFADRKPFRVEISYKKRFIKVDSRWVDHCYQNLSDEGGFRRYWQSEKFHEADDSWEYLLDGHITFVDSDQLSYLREYGALLPAR